MPPTFISIDPQFAPPSWKGVANPVARLHRSLYGMPDSGKEWDMYAHQQLTKAGWTTLENELRIYTKGNAALMRYVDDLILTALKEHMEPW